MDGGMKLARSVAAGVAALGLLAGAGLVVTPVAMQRSAGASPQVVNVDGHAAVAGEVLVKFRRSLASHERRHPAPHAAADRTDGTGRPGVWRIHSTRYST